MRDKKGNCYFRHKIPQNNVIFGFEKCEPWKYKYLDFLNLISGEKTSPCTTGNIIGSNTGVYVGGLPLNFPLIREETDSRAQVDTFLIESLNRLV